MREGAYFYHALAKVAWLAGRTDRNTLAVTSAVYGPLPRPENSPQWHGDLRPDVRACELRYDRVPASASSSKGEPPTATQHY